MVGEVLLIYNYFMLRIGVPLLYMILVVPLGFLVNTEHIVGSHYGRRDAITGQLYE